MEKTRFSGLEVCNSNISKMNFTHNSSHNYLQTRYVVSKELKCKVDHVHAIKEEWGYLLYPREGAPTSTE